MFTTYTEMWLITMLVMIVTATDMTYDHYAILSL